MKGAGSGGPPPCGVPVLLNQPNRHIHIVQVHIMKILLKDVKLVVKMGKHYGEEILTNIGVPQADCCSPILFTLYLANALREDLVHEDHTYSKPYITQRTG